MTVAYNNVSKIQARASARAFFFGGRKLREAMALTANHAKYAKVSAAKRRRRRKIFFVAPK